MSKPKANRRGSKRASAPKKKSDKRAGGSLSLVQPREPEPPELDREEESPNAELRYEIEDVFEPPTPEEEDQLDDLLEEMKRDDGYRENADGDEAATCSKVDVDAHVVTPEASSRLMAVTAATLIAHCGARKITRDELALIPVPEATRTHQPLALHRVVEALVEALAFRHISVAREEYAVSQDGARMFGVMDLDAEWNGVRFSIGIRNSNDKSMRLGMTSGYRVTVCDNMMFKGDFAPVFHKHTRRLELLDVISIGVDKMQRGFAPLKAQIGEWQRMMLTDDEARLLIYRAFLEERFPRAIMSEVHRQYFEPYLDEFRPRTLWSLSNAFTSAFKLLKPIRQFTATAKLGAYMEM
jgi:hypothetical protein